MLITVLSLTIFAFEAAKAQNRIGGTFTLILTRFDFFVTIFYSLSKFNIYFYNDVKKHTKNRIYKVSFISPKN